MRTIHRIARKVHVCEACSDNIAPGEKYELIEARWPKEASNIQIGIIFFRMKFHHINGVTCLSYCEYNPVISTEKNKEFFSKPFGDNNIK